jgi:O-antigen/teichoic acid export membrane protein
MNEVVEEIKPPKRGAKKDATRKQIRGSSLLLVGRVLSVGINFASQVMLVRYLSTTDFGAWAYGLSIVAFCQSLAIFGLDRAITRFVPIYHEKEEYNKLFGTIILVVGSVLLIGLLIVGAFYIAPEKLAGLMKDGQAPVALLLIMIILVPVEAFDALMNGLFASFTNPRAIFLRKHVLGPSLKLAAVALMIFFKSSVVFLAYGYLGAYLLGIALYVYFFIRLLRQQNLFEHFSFGAVKLPVKELFAFTLPLLSSDLVAVLMHSSDTFLLGYFHDTTQVAMFRVVLPAAHMNNIVLAAFGMLFTPLAARLFAKNDYAGINELYWRSATWMGVLSFPIFALTFSLAKPLTIFLYGARYEPSWVILSLLSFGYYFHVALGNNGLTLKVLGKLRYIVVINILAAIVNVVLNLLLIPRYGALGAAIGTTSTMVAHGIFKQTGLRLVAGISPFEWRFLSFYLLIAASGLALFLIQFFIADNIYLAVALAGIVTLAVFWFGRKKLQIAETFPEMMKIGIIKKFFGN